MSGVEWHLNLCKLLYAKMIWTKRASLVIRVYQNQFPNGKEAENVSFVSRCGIGSARRHGDLYFAALLPQDHILKAFGAARGAWQGWVYTPAVTVWVFLSQCLSPDHSCREAVARLIAWRLAAGLSPCSADTGAYCTARGDLPEETLHTLVRETGKQVEEESPETWLWHGRNVRVVDGSTVTMPDTEENQAVYPQSKTQKPGCGFPIARILVIFSLSVGTVLEALIGKYKGKQTGENSLFRKLHDTLTEGDIILADRYFSGWSDIALPLAARHRHRRPQASTPSHGFPHGHATGQRRSPDLLGQTTTADMDVGRTICRRCQTS